jgi:hypothetical protein
MWLNALDELGEKVCEFYPFIYKLCGDKGHFNFQCSGPNSNRISTVSFIVMTRSLSINMMSLLCFWGMKSYLERLLW